MKRIVVCSIVAIAFMLPRLSSAQVYSLEGAAGILTGSQVNGSLIVGLDLNFLVGKSVAVGPFVYVGNGISYGIGVQVGSDPSRKIQYFGQAKLGMGSSYKYFDNDGNGQGSQMTFQGWFGGGAQYNLTRVIGIRGGVMYVTGDEFNFTRGLLVTAAVTFKMLRKK